MHVLVTGGAGYVGSVLCPLLLREGFRVTVLDRLLFGGRGILPCFESRDFRLVKGDVRNEALLRDCLQGCDLVIHLAALVGYPICKKYPKEAEEVNLGATVLLNEIRGRSIPMLNASTGSNYGSVDKEICREETALNPLTTYGRTKTRAEMVTMETGNAISYRFATAFGLSNRLRLDLLPNDFCYCAKIQRNLIVYEKNFKRTFIHVRDMGRAFIHAIKNYDSMKDKVYNVGDESMNYTKEDIALKIRERTDFYLHFAEIGKDEDQRNYEVSYDRIRSTGFRTSISMDDGIDELLRAMSAVEIQNEYSNV